jgi:hypothetical protein
VIMFFMLRSKHLYERTSNRYWRRLDGDVVWFHILYKKAGSYLAPIFS